jgi:hypothetical protein
VCAVGYVYLIDDGRGYKIGITTSIKKRARKYVTENPHAKMVEFYECKACERAERVLKQRLAAHLKHGREWFKRVEEVVTVFQAVKLEFSAEPELAVQRDIKREADRQATRQAAQASQDELKRWLEAEKQKRAESDMVRREAYQRQEEDARRAKEGRDETQARDAAAITHVPKRHEFALSYPSINDGVGKETLETVETVVCLGLFVGLVLFIFAVSLG